LASFVTGDGVRLNYTDNGTGQPLVFVPGWAMSGNWWQEQRNHFAKRNRVVVLDPRGQGDSEAVHWGHRLARHAADLNDVIVTLGLKELVLVGWSRGTSVLLSYLELFGSERISAMALCGFTPSLARRSDWPWGFNVPPQQFIDSVVADYPSVVRAMIPDMTHRVLSSEFVASRIEESLRTPPVAAARMLEDHMSIDWRDMLPKIDLPVLICAGEHDEQAPIASAEAAAKLIRRSTIVRFADSGHCPFAEEPAAFNRALEAFLEEYAHG
jgi:non-heme chloroperoxidase